MTFLLIILGGSLFFYLIYFLFQRMTTSRWKTPSEEFPKQWRVVLQEHAAFYRSLNQEEKQRFEYKIQEFLLNCRITGIKTSIDDTDRLLVAASAIIPIFGFENWRYNNISEVLIYPNAFNRAYETEGEDRRVLGMVGTGYLRGTMILSRAALHHGFKNESDKKNTAIHEFVHLLDKADGVIDGIPAQLMDKQYAIPWIDLMQRKIDEVYEHKTDINPYGGTNRAEFFSVTSEYFFERPKLLERKHPELYKLLETIFRQDLSSVEQVERPKKIGRNDPCPCGSRKKFKICCGRGHY